MTTMAPPRVRIKRKKDEEPVDALYLEVEQGHHQQKRRCRDTEVIFRRVGVAAARTALPRAVSGIIEAVIPTQSKSDPFPRPDASESEQEGAPARTGVEKLRQYHLTPSATQVNGYKPNYPHKANAVGVATFIELRDGASAKNSEPGEIPAAPSNEPLRKRPNVAAAETAWRKEQRLRLKSQDSAITATEAPPKAKGAEQRHYDDPLLLAQLQEFTMQELRNQEEIEQVKARPRHDTGPTRDRGSLAVTDSREDEIMEDADYIYDEFIRESVSTQLAMADPQQKIGLLVITEGNKAVWEMLLTNEEESDKEFQSDEDDENAEDYYGNDYPDDESASEESGSEEDEDNDAEWSDEDDPRPAWNRYPAGGPSGMRS